MKEKEKERERERETLTCPSTNPKHPRYPKAEEKRETQKSFLRSPNGVYPGRRRQIPNRYIHGQHPIINIELSENPYHLLHDNFPSYPSLSHVLMIHPVPQPYRYLQLIHLLHIFQHHRRIRVPVLLPPFHKPALFIIIVVIISIIDSSMHGRI